MAINDIEVPPQTPPLLGFQGIENIDPTDEDPIETVNSVLAENKQLKEDLALIWEVVRDLSRRVELNEKHDVSNLSSPLSVDLFCACLFSLSLFVHN